MAVQWRETSFLASQAAGRTQVPIDFEVEEPEEDLDFILEVEEAIEPTKVEIYEGFSSSDSEDEAQITVIEARPRRDPDPEATTEEPPITLEALQNELHVMQSETRALRDLLAHSESSGGEVVEGVVNAWQRQDVYEGVGRRAEAGMIAVGVTSTTRQVVLHRQYTEEVVTSQRSPSKRKRRPKGDRSSLSGASPGSARLWEVRDVIDQAAAETLRENEFTEEANRMAATRNLPSITYPAIDEMVREEPGTGEGDADSSHATTQATEHPQAEEDSATGELVIEDVTDEPIRAIIIDELLKDHRDIDAPIRRDIVNRDPINENTVTAESLRANTGIDDPIREATVTEDAINDHLLHEEPTRDHLRVEDSSTESLTPQEPDTVDITNDRRSRSSYHYMVEDMGQSSEDDLSQEWNEEDFKDEVYSRHSSETPDISEATEFTQLTMTETGNDLAAEELGKEASIELSDGEMKASGEKMNHKSSLGVETVVKPYLETNLDNPVLFHQGKESEVKSSPEYECSDRESDKTLKLDLLKLDVVRGLEMEETPEVQPEYAIQDDVQPTLEHKTDEAGRVSPKLLNEAQQKEPTEIDNLKPLPEAASILVAQTIPETNFQPHEDSSNAPSSITTSPVADDSHAMEPALEVKHRGATGGRKRPSHKPPPPPSTTSGAPGQGSFASSLKSPSEETSLFNTRSISYTDSSSPRSVGSSIASLGSEALVAEDVVQVRDGSRRDDPTTEGFKRVSAVYEELDMIQIPQVPPPPPRNETSLKQSVDSDSLPTAPMETPSPMLSEASDVILADLDKIEMLEIPPPPPRHPPPSAVSQASPSPTNEVPVTVTQKDGDTSSQPVAVPLGQLMFDLGEIEMTDVPPPPPRHPPPPSTSQSNASPPLMFSPQEIPEALLPVSETFSLPASELLEFAGGLIDNSVGDLEPQSASTLLDDGSGTTERILEKLERIEIPEVPPPPPIKPPPLSMAESSHSQLCGPSSLIAMAESSHSQLCGPSSLIAMAESSHSQLCGPSSLIEDDSPTEFEQTPPCMTTSSSPSLSSEVSQGEGAEAMSSKLMKKLEEIDIPEVPPPPPRGPPPAASESTLTDTSETLPTQTHETSSIQDPKTIETHQSEIYENPKSEFSPGQTPEPTKSQSPKSCATSPNDVLHRNSAVTPPHVPPFQLLKKLEKMEIPGVPPPPPRQPPPCTSDTTLTRHNSEAHSANTFQFSPSGTQVSPPISPDFPSHSDSVGPLQELLETTVTPESLSTSPETPESPIISLVSSPAEAKKAPSPSRRHVFPPHTADVASSKLLEELDKMTIPEVPPPPPRRLPPPPPPRRLPPPPPPRRLPPPPPRQSPPPQCPLPSPRSCMMSSISESPSLPGTESSSRQTSESSVTSSHDECSGTSPESSPTQALVASPTNYFEAPEASPSEDSSMTSLPTAASPPPLQLSQVSLDQHDDSLFEEQPRSSLTQLLELSDNEVLLMANPNVVFSRVPDEQVPDVYLAEVFENSLAKFPTEREETPEPQGFHLSYVTALDGQFSPSEEETTSSSGDSSSCEEEHSSSDDEEASSSSDSSSTSEEEASSASETCASPIPEIMISFAPEQQLDSNEEPDTSQVAEEPSSPEQPASPVTEQMVTHSSDEEVSPAPGKDVSSVPEMAVSSVPERNVSSIPQRNVSSIPEKEVSSVPEKDVSFVPGKDVYSVSEKDVSSAPEMKNVSSAPEMAVSSIPERDVSLVPEKDVYSVSGKDVSSVPETAISSLPENTISSVPEKDVSSVPEKTVSSTLEKAVSSVPEKEVSSISEMGISSVPEKVVSSSLQETSSVPEKTVASVPEKTVTSVPEKTVASVPEKTVASVPEKTVASVPEKTVASVPEKTVVSVPDTIVSSVPETIVSSVPETVVASVPEMDVSFVPEKAVSSIPEMTVSSVPVKSVSSSSDEEVSSEPENILSSPQQVSPSSSSSEASLSPHDEESPVPEITISFAPEMEFPYASEEEQEIFSSPEKVSSLVEEGTSFAAVKVSPKSEAKHEASSALHYSDSKQDETGLETFQEDASAPDTPSHSRQNENFPPEEDVDDFSTDEKTDKSEPLKETNETLAGVAVALQGVLEDLATPVIESSSSQEQETSLTQEHSAATLQKEGSDTPKDVVCPTQEEHPLTLGVITFSSLQVTSPMTPMEPSPPQPSEASHDPSAGAPQIMQPNVSPTNFFPGSTVEVMGELEGAVASSTPSGVKEKGKEEEKEVKEVKEVQDKNNEKEEEDEATENEEEDKRGRERAMSQSSEETEEEYFTPPSGTPPYSPLQERKQVFGELSFESPGDRHPCRGAGHTVEVVTWGHEVEVILDPSQSPRDEENDAIRSHLDAEKRHSRQDEATLPSTKRRRLSCDNEEEDFRSLLTVARVRSRSPSPSGRRVSRIAQAIGDALSTDDPETSYEILVTVSVTAPSQSTSPESRIRISTQMRGESPTPPPRPSPTPTLEFSVTKEDSETQPVVLQAIKSGDRHTSPTDATSSSLSLPAHESATKPSKKKSKKEKSRDKRSRRQKETAEESDLRTTAVTSLQEGEKEETKEEEEEVNEAAKRAMMEFYVNNLSSDTDSDASTTSTSTSSSDDEGEDDGRSYQVTAPGEVGLATIEEDAEDAEEDSGAESSGHWMFSADNTDTDSVIHVPAALPPGPPDAPQRHPTEDGESTASDETLVVEDDEDEDEEGVCGGEEGRGGRQEAGVTVSLARTPASPPTTGGHYDSSASEDEHDSQGTERQATGSSLRAVHRKRRKPGDGRAAGGVHPHTTMLGSTHAARIFEKHVDDVFDFESLESCESVSGGSQASSPGLLESLSGLEEPDAVFNMSATSQPFADASPTVTNAANRRKTTGGESSEVISEPNGSEGSAAPPQLPCEEAGVVSVSSSARATEEEIEGDLKNVISNPVTDLALPATNSDASQPPGSVSPHSMDMFGLPVRWTPGHDPRHTANDTTATTNKDTTLIEAEKDSVMQMRSDRDTETFADTAPRLNVSCGGLAQHSEARDVDAAAPYEIDPSTLPSGAPADSTDDVQVESAAATMVCEAPQQETVSGATFTPHTAGGENSSEACHRHSPHGPAHPHHISLSPLPQKSEGEAPELPPSGASDQDVSEDAMRAALRTPSQRGGMAASVAVEGANSEQVIPQVSDTKVTGLYGTREARYVSPRPRPQTLPSVTCKTDLPSGDSDTDTDNTDGDYDEEDHFAAELSLRISSAPPSATTKVKSFRSSDILNLIGLERGRAGPSEAGGAPDEASQAGSSPEVPDSLRSSEGHSATRSVETLSEDSGLGDRDVRLTPSSPLAPISEAASHQPPAAPSAAFVNSRPRRQEARLARIARARSCGDLRGYSESDSEEEEGAMSAWLPHSAAHPLPEGMNGNACNNRTQPRQYKPSYTSYLLQQQQQRCGDELNTRPRHPLRPLPLSGSEGSDEDLRSRFTNHRVFPSGHSKPRRHKSFHEASKQDSTCWPASAAIKETWAPGGTRPGRRRPQPISVDLAEQFLSQEGLKSPQRKQTVESPYGGGEGQGEGEEWRVQHPPSLPGTGGVACQAARATPANQRPLSEVSINGAGVGSAGSYGEQGAPASPLTPELTEVRAWPAAQAAPSLVATPARPAPCPPSSRAPLPAPLPHQYSSTPAQLPNECQPVHTGRSSSSPTHDPPPATPDSELRAASDLNDQCLPGRSGAALVTPDTVTAEMAEAQMRVHTKTYGSHGEVEVYLATCDNGCRPPNTSPVLTPRGGAEHRPGSRGVTFSPSVKEINWRESYYEAEPEGEGSGSDVRKVLVVTSESPTPQRPNLTPSPPYSHAPATNYSQEANKTHESNLTASGAPVTDTDKSNGRLSEAPAGSSSDAEMSGDKSPKVQTPLWQRFKLPKISSPKSPRPKIPPKPQSLSSRSSDTESSKLSSPGVDSGSSAPSSPDTKAKKAPSSPRFFSWGSKREKKVRVLPPRPLVSPPPPPAHGDARQRDEGSGDQSGVKGEPDPAAAVSPAVLPREDRACASDNEGNRVRQEAQLVLPPARQERVTEFPARLVKADKPLLTGSNGFSQEPGRSPLTSATSGEDSSDAGQQPSPRAALSKPPLPPHLQRPTQQVFHKARLISARRQYFSQERQVSAPERASPPKEVRPAPPPRPRDAPQHTTSSRYKSVFDASNNLKERFEKFSASARAERERLARSTPDLSVIEASVRRQGIDLWGQCEQQQQQQAESHPASPASASDGDAARPDLAHRGASSTHHKARAAIHERYKSRAQRIHARARSQNSGVLETDLDTGASREVLTLPETNLDDLYRDLQHLLESIPSVGGAPLQADKARAKSLLDLEASAAMEAQLDTPARAQDTRAKSMEFLLDDGNKAAVQPPENELMKGSERQLSEAELRVRRSLQRLDVPEWMKNAPTPQQGFLLRRRDYGSSSAPAGGWSAYSSKTASMTSLGSSRAVTPNTPTKVVIPTRVASRGMGGLTSPASNCSISPSPSDRSGSLFQYPSSRWSSSRLNSGTTTPTGSVTSARTTSTYTHRQPYLGWRSQTSLANLAGSQSSLTSTGSYLTASDRLALGITAYSQRFVKTTPSTQDKENSSAEANAAAPKPDHAEQNDTGSTNGSVKLQVPSDVADVHSSIKEVTSAIVHYCNESTPSPRASPRGSPRPEGRAPSPRRLVWVESSFVGSRPITSPETPTSSTHAITPTSQLNGHDLPESGEVTSRPPQPPGEYLMAW